MKEKFLAFLSILPFFIVFTFFYDSAFDLDCF